MEKQATLKEKVNRLNTIFFFFLHAVMRAAIFEAVGILLPTPEKHF